MKARVTVAVLGVILSSASPVLAQVRVLVHASYDSTALASSESFEAIAGVGSVEGPSVGLTLTRLWRDVFVDVTAARRTLEGERVFVHDGTVFRLGIPTTIHWRPLDIAAGWRMTGRRYTPYAAIGLTTIAYKESSEFARAGDDVSETASGLLLVGGIDIRVWRWMSLGGEVRHRSVTGVLGVGGVSEVFGEDQLGGTTVGIRVSVIR